MVRFIVWSKSNVMHCELEGIRRILAMYQRFPDVQMGSIVINGRIKPMLMITDNNHEVNAVGLYRVCRRLGLELIQKDASGWTLHCDTGRKMLESKAPENPYGGSEVSGVSGVVLHYLDEFLYVTAEMIIGL